MSAVRYAFRLSAWWQYAVRQWSWAAVLCRTVPCEQSCLQHTEFVFVRPKLQTR